MCVKKTFTDVWTALSKSHLFPTKIIKVDLQEGSLQKNFQIRKKEVEKKIYSLNSFI